MTTRATEHFPSPLAADGTVDVDPAARTLVVRLSERERGYARLIYRTGHAALVRSQQIGYLSDVPTVWASTPNERQVAFGLPGDGMALLFRFPAQPGSAYSELVGKPGLSCLIMLDREHHHILGVALRHRPAV